MVRQKYRRIQVDAILVFIPGYYSGKRAVSIRKWLVYISDIPLLALSGRKKIEFLQKVLIFPV